MFVMAETGAAILDMDVEATSCGRQNNATEGDGVPEAIWGQANLRLSRFLLCVKEKCQLFWILCYSKLNLNLN